jgi:hypothetical protein
MDPMTIPAIAPPDNLLPLVPAAAAALLVAEGTPVEVDEGKSGGIEVEVGNLTPTHRLLTSEPMQQESVAFGELAAQYPHSPGRLFR